MQWVRSALEARTVQALQEHYASNRELPKEKFYHLTRSIFSEARRIYDLVLFGESQPPVFPDNHPFRSLDELYFSLHPFNWNDNPRQVVERFVDICNASPDRKSRVIPLDEKRVIKYSDHGLIEEAIAMELVRIKTTVPVPQALMTFVHNGQTFLVMSKIDGTDLRNSDDDLPPLQMQIIARELAQHINSIRQLGELLVPSSSDISPFIGSWFGGRLENVVFNPAHSSAFKSYEDLWSYWEQRLVRHRQIQRLSSFRIVISHGDLNPRNVMIKDGHVVGIVDWDTFGWYPDFWEFMMMERQTAGYEQHMTEAFLEEAGPFEGIEDIAKAVDEALYYS
jgi:aminoglycoside phosphotransferase